MEQYLGIGIAKHEHVLGARLANGGRHGKAFAFANDEQHMPKRGSAPLRNALMTAADRARMNDPYFGDYYDSLRARGKHRYVAVSGCARKLCGVILAVLRERRPFESFVSGTMAFRAPIAQLYRATAS